MSEYMFSTPDFITFDDDSDAPFMPFTQFINTYFNVFEPTLICAVWDTTQFKYQEFSSALGYTLVSYHPDYTPFLQGDPLRLSQFVQTSLAPSLNKKEE
ncbi:MAG: hypothetical protein RML35_12140 [Chloroherpetonaceae bacterium]|nr:hypothetical protein [Chloroherpetonaceae bacterium]